MNKDVNSGTIAIQNREKDINSSTSNYFADKDKPKDQDHAKTDDTAVTAESTSNNMISATLTTLTFGPSNRSGNNIGNPFGNSSTIKGSSDSTTGVGFSSSSTKGGVGRGVRKGGGKDSFSQSNYNNSRGRAGNLSYHRGDSLNSSYSYHRDGDRDLYFRGSDRTYFSGTSSSKGDRTTGSTSSLKKSRSAEERNFGNYSYSNSYGSQRGVGSYRGVGRGMTEWKPPPRGRVGRGMTEWKPRGGEWKSEWKPVSTSTSSTSSHTTKDNAESTKTLSSTTSEKVLPTTSSHFFPEKEGEKNSTSITSTSTSSTTTTLPGLRRDGLVGAHSFQPQPRKK